MKACFGPSRVYEFSICGRELVFVSICLYNKKRSLYIYWSSG